MEVRAVDPATGATKIAYTENMSSSELAAWEQSQGAAGQSVSVIQPKGPVPSQTVPINDSPLIQAYKSPSNEPSPSNNVAPSLPPAQQVLGSKPTGQDMASMYNMGYMYTGQSGYNNMTQNWVLRQGLPLAAGTYTAPGGGTYKIDTNAPLTTGAAATFGPGATEYTRTITTNKPASGDAGMINKPSITQTSMNVSPTDVISKGSLSFVNGNMQSNAYNQNLQQAVSSLPAGQSVSPSITQTRVEIPGGTKNMTAGFDIYKVPSLGDVASMAVTNAPYYQRLENMTPSEKNNLVGWAVTGGKYLDYAYGNQTERANIEAMSLKEISEINKSDYASAAITHVMEGPAGEIGKTMVAGVITDGAITTLGIGSSPFVKVASLGVGAVYAGGVGLETASQLQSGQTMEAAKTLTHAAIDTAGFMTGYGIGKENPLRIESIYNTEGKTVARSMYLDTGAGNAKPIISQSSEGIKVFKFPESPETIKAVLSQPAISPLETNILERNINNLNLPRATKTDIADIISTSKNVYQSQPLEHGMTFDTSRVTSSRMTPGELKAGFETAQQEAGLLRVNTYVYGTAAQKGYGLLGRDIHDIDFMSRNPEASASRFLANAQKYGSEAYVNPAKPSEVLNKAGDKIFEAHSTNELATELGPKYGDYVGLGFKAKPTVKIEGMNLIEPTEQVVRKAAGAEQFMRLTDNDFAQRRGKDIADYAFGAKELSNIESSAGKAFPSEQSSKIERLSSKYSSEAISKPETLTFESIKTEAKPISSLFSSSSSESPFTSSPSTYISMGRTSPSSSLSSKSLSLSSPSGSVSKLAESQTLSVPSPASSTSFSVNSLSIGSLSAPSLSSPSLSPSYTSISPGSPSSPSPSPSPSFYYSPSPSSPSLPFRSFSTPLGFGDGSNLRKRYGKNIKRFSGYAPSLAGIASGRFAAHAPKGYNPLGVRPMVKGQGIPTGFLSGGFALNSTKHSNNRKILGLR